MASAARGEGVCIPTGSLPAGPRRPIARRALAEHDPLVYRKRTLPAHVSNRAQALDADYRAFMDSNGPVRSFEGLLIAVYQYQLKDGWTVQPNFQYVVHPGGRRHITGRPARR